MNEKTVLPFDESLEKQVTQINQILSKCRTCFTAQHLVNIKAPVTSIIVVTFAANSFQFNLNLRNMKWAILLAGIIFEVLGTICMKYAEGFTKLVPSILVFVFYGISLAALVFVLEKMQVSVAYAIWASCGTALIAVIGIVFFRETVSVVKIISISLIILGILGLELFD